MTLPAPWQVGQVRSMVKKPWVARTLPAPRQVGHSTGAAPSAPPVPLQARSADVELGTLISAGLAGEGLFQGDLQL